MKEKAMPDDALSKLLPWLFSIVFGAGAGWGASKAVNTNQSIRLGKIENWQEEKGMTKEFHCVKCSAAQKDNLLETERIVNTAVEKLGDRILDRIDKFHGAK